MTVHGGSTVIHYVMGLNIGSLCLMCRAFSMVIQKKNRRLSSPESVPNHLSHFTEVNNSSVKMKTKNVLQISYKEVVINKNVLNVI